MTFKQTRVNAFRLLECKSRRRRKKATLWAKTANRIGAKGKPSPHISKLKRAARQNLGFYSLRQREIYLQSRLKYLREIEIPLS